jgi:hypothetical protein
VQDDHGVEAPRIIVAVQGPLAAALPDDARQASYVSTDGITPATPRSRTTTLFFYQAGATT